MFKHADILVQRDGSVVLAIPDAFATDQALTLVLRRRGFALMAGQQTLGDVDGVGADVLDRLRRQTEVRVIACPPGMTLNDAEIRRAQLRL